MKKFIDSIRNNFDFIMAMIYTLGLMYTVRQMFIYYTAGILVGVIVHGFFGVLLWIIINNWLISAKTTRNLKFILSVLESNDDYMNDRFDDLEEAVKKLEVKKNVKK